MEALPDGQIRQPWQRRPPPSYVLHLPRVAHRRWRSLLPRAAPPSSSLDLFPRWLVHPPLPHLLLRRPWRPDQLLVATSVTKVAKSGRAVVVRGGGVVAPAPVKVWWPDPLLANVHAVDRASPVADRVTSATTLTRRGLHPWRRWHAGVAARGPNPDPLGLGCGLFISFCFFILINRGGQSTCLHGLLIKVTFDWRRLWRLPPLTPFARLQ